MFNFQVFSQNKPNSFPRSCFLFHNGGYSNKVTRTYMVVSISVPISMDLCYCPPINLDNGKHIFLGLGVRFWEVVFVGSFAGITVFIYGSMLLPPNQSRQWQAYFLRMRKIQGLRICNSLDRDKQLFC